MTPQQLHLTQIRVAAETALGSGTAAADWIQPPMTAAVAQREVAVVASRQSVFRQPAKREVIHDAWTLAISSEASTGLLRWILEQQMTTGEDFSELTPESPTASLVIESTAPPVDGRDPEISVFAGAVAQEIRIAVEERKIARIDATYAALTRTERTTPLTGTTAVWEREPLIASATCTAAMTPDDWSDLPFVYDTKKFHGAQIFLTREIAPANFGPDGKPETFITSGWRVMAEILMPATPGITDAAIDGEWNGRIAIQIGGDTLWMQAATGIISADDLLGFDWRTYRLTLEGFAGNTRSILDFSRG